MTEKIDELVRELFEIRQKLDGLLVYPKPMKYREDIKKKLKSRKDELILAIGQALKNETPEKAQKIKTRLSSELAIYLP